MDIKQMLKQNAFIYSTYRKWKHRYDFERNASLIYPQHINNREKLVIILAGYKEELWEVVFERFRRFIPKDYDVCIVSSGKDSLKLRKIAKTNEWAYLPLRKNNVCVALNTAIDKFPQAKCILKLDEDIFLTAGSIEELEKAYAEPKVSYSPGFVAPIIPINGFGYAEFLREFNLQEAYQSRFGNIIHGAGPDKPIENNADVAKFIWESGDLDTYNAILQKRNQQQVACPIRFSIGAILFERQLWENMDYFQASRSGNDMGKDEEQIDGYCLMNSKPMIVSKNALMGHLSFGRQNKEMYTFFEAHKSIFKVHETN